MCTVILFFKLILSIFRLKFDFDTCEHKLHTCIYAYCPIRRYIFYLFFLFYTFEHDRNLLHNYWIKTIIKMRVRYHHHWNLKNKKPRLS